MFCLELFRMLISLIGRQWKCNAHANILTIAWLTFITHRKGLEFSSIQPNEKNFSSTSQDLTCLILILYFVSGGLFDIRESSSVDSSVDVKQETVFRRCVDTVNSLNILHNSTLSTQIERVPATDPFHTAKRGNDSLTARRLHFSIFSLSCHLHNL